MKKIITGCMLFLSIAAFSQNPKVRFGVQAGLNYSNLRGYDIPNQIEYLYDESPAFAYLIGINAEYQLKDKLSLRAELSYERKTQKADNVVELRDNFDDPVRTLRFITRKHYDYLVLPLLIKYTFTDKNSFYVNGGPFVGYLLQSKTTNDLNDPELSDEDIDTTNDNKKTDFGFSFGIGKEINLQKNSISIEIRENLGLAKTNKYDVWNGGNVKTNSINLLVSYSFN